MGSTGRGVTSALYRGLLRGRPHGNILLCKRTFCIVLADRPHGSCKRTFLEPGLRVEKSENAALAFLCGQRIRIISISMTPLPHPATSSL